MDGLSAISRLSQPRPLGDVPQDAPGPAPAPRSRSRPEHPLATGSRPPPVPAGASGLRRERASIQLLENGRRAEASLAKGAEARTDSRAGSAGAGVHAALTARAGAGAQVGLDKETLLPRLNVATEAATGVEVRQHAEAGLRPLKLGQRELVHTPLGVQQSGELFSGTRAGAAAAVGPQGVDARVEAFAGAKAGGTAGLTVADQTVKVSGDVRTGVGVEMDVRAGLHKTPQGRTKLKAGGKLGAALGVGGAVGAGVELDVTPIAKAVEALPGPAREGVKRVGNTLGQTAKTTVKSKTGVLKTAAKVVKAPFKFLKKLFS